MLVTALSSFVQTTTTSSSSTTQSDDDSSEIEIDQEEDAGIWLGSEDSTEDLSDDSEPPSQEKHSKRYRRSQRDDQFFG